MMFRTLVGSYKEIRTLKKITGHPVLGPVFHDLRETLNDTSKGLGKYASVDDKTSLYDKVLTQVQGAIALPDPTRGVRLKLIEIMMQTAAYQVLVIPPRPELDESGLRSFEGITGELKSRIPELAEKDDHLKELFYSLDNTAKDIKDMVDAILLQYWTSSLYLSAFHVARCALKDYHNDPYQDWYRPCFISQCIWMESNYRNTLGLPSALCGSLPEIRALLHASWFKLIEGGVQELRLAWEESWTAAFHEPSPYGAPLSE